MNPASILLFAVMSALQSHMVFAQDNRVDNRSMESQQLVEYPAAYFQRYQPATALDMVRQVPGFSLNDGDADRGFIAAVGNVLINDKYPSAKQDVPSAILDRIPANLVSHIELIRGQVRGIDLQGQAVVVNVILTADPDAVVRWDLYTRHNTVAPLKPGVDVSLSDSLRGFDYTAGVRVEREANGESGRDYLYDANGLLEEESVLDQESTGIDLTGTLNVSGWIGRTLTTINTRLHHETRSPLEISRYTPRISGKSSREQQLGTDSTINQFEFGMDAARTLGNWLAGKGIFLIFREQLPRFSTRTIFDNTGKQLSARVADSESITTEVVGRLELDWTGIADHNVQLNLEGAFNSLENSLLQTIDNGFGPVETRVPGANTRVEESRGDFMLKDIWTLGRFELDYGLGTEISSISQTGDAEKVRHFIFMKPQAVLVYAADEDNQSRIRLAREVAQLDFDDFVSATVFEDDDLALGNPDLRPDTTWVAEASHEHRFGRSATLKLTLFHHWIEDVLDLLPLSPAFEAPGNIGDGRRWGMEIESTLPLDWLGLSGAKLDAMLQLQDSSVTDPVTGNRRVLSGQGGVIAYRTLVNLNRNNRYQVRLDFRQDLESARIAWGWTVAERDRRPLFKVNELDVNNESAAVDAFIETSRWAGLKVSLLGENLMNFITRRTRTFYTGERDLSAVDSVEVRERYTGRRLTLTVSGSF
jgi:hypothetical protein